MKRILILTMILCMFTGAALFADTLEEPILIEDDPVKLVSPITEAMGGASTALPSGFESLYTNPAGLSRKGGELTFLSVNVGPYFLPTENMISLAEGLINGDEISDYSDDLASLLEGLDLENGAGTNVNIGMGLSAFGLGLGFLTDIDILATQDGAITTMQLTPEVTSSLSAGISHGFRLGSTKLHLGGVARAIAKIRPTSNTISLTTLTDLIGGESSVDIDTYPVGLSLGYGFDAGMVYELQGGLAMGATLKNIGGTEFITANQSLGGIEDALNEYSDPQGLFDTLTADEITDFSYVIPMSLTVGAGYESKGFLGYKLAADYTYTFYEDEENIEDDTLWKNIHLGGEISLLKILKLRGGINQGYFTAGAGLDLFLLQVNAAYYSRELGNYAGHKQNEAFVVGAKVLL